MLGWVKDMPSLKAISFIAEETGPLDTSVLTELPHAPPSLEYIGWGFEYKMTPYRVVREQARTYAVETDTVRGPNNGRKWIDHTVLDHFGDSAREW